MTGGLGDRRRDYRRAVWIGLGISAFVHLLLLFGLARSLRIPATERPAADVPTIELQGPVAMDIGRVLSPEELPPEEERDEDEIPPPEERPAEEQPVLPPQGPPVVADQGVPDAAADDGYLTNAERLQPQEGDERLWREVEDDRLPEYLADNPYAAYEGEIRARLSMLLDSLNLSEAQRRRAIEWLTGDEGAEWGVSEDGLHIGGVLIPINLGSLFAEEGPSGRETRQELRDLQDIRYHDMLDDARDVQDDRARQMRERTKEELERRVRDSLEAAADSAEAVTD